MRNRFYTSGSILLLIGVFWVGCDSAIRVDAPPFRVHLISPTPGEELTQVAPGETLTILATISDAESVESYDIILLYGPGSHATKWHFTISESMRSTIVEIDQMITIPISSQLSSNVGAYTLQLVATSGVEAVAVRARLRLVSSK